MKTRWVFFDIGGVLADESEYGKIRKEIIWETIKSFQSTIKKDEILELWPKASAMLGSLDENIIMLTLKDSSDISPAINLLRKKKMRTPSYDELLKISQEAKIVIPKLASIYKLGIMANQGSVVRKKMKEAGILSYFQSTKVSADYNLQKPDLRFFQEVLKKINVDPHNAVMVDDNIERGLIPAKKLGMITIWYKHRERDVPVGIVDYTISSLEELLSISPINLTIGKTNKK